MTSEEELYGELEVLRERMRAEHPMANGRPPAVCSDEALREMARRVPTRKRDFSAIVGVGQRFIEVYGQEFLKVTRKYAVSAARGSEITPGTAGTLRELEKKLIDISRSNRLIFQGRLSRKNAFDLTSLRGVDALSLVSGGNAPLVLCDSSDGADGLKAYKRLNEIYREANRESRDRGQYDLYLAYPFVKGRAPKGDLCVRAPLALFPVVLDRSGGAMVLSADGSRDAVYNNALILAFMKAAGENSPLPDSTMEYYRPDTLVSDLVGFYGDNGIRLNVSGIEPTGFVECAADDLPPCPAEGLEVVPNVVLGRYPIYSSSIQRDFDTILAGNEINGILSDLVSELDESDFYSDLPGPLSHEEIAAKGMNGSERDLTYINALNSAQEDVLAAVEHEDEVVVQGPPGTGKSQVIAGLIGSAVLEGRTVLMVSEKKTALDVVHSRLGDLSKYCLLIDDMGNKDLFYSQLETMLAPRPPVRGADTGALSDRIDGDVALLQGIADTFYSPCGFGIEPYKLYGMCLHDGQDRGRREERAIEKGIDRSLLSLGYGEVSGLHRRFGDPRIMRCVSDYRAMTEEHPWMTQLKDGLADPDIGTMRAGLLDLEHQMIDYRSKGFVGRLFSKGRVSREATLLADRYFRNYNEHTLAAIKDDPKSMSDALDDYDLFADRNAAYNRLTPGERRYGSGIMDIASASGLPPSESNDRAFEWILGEHLREFDAGHGDAVGGLADFDRIISDMDEAISMKRDLTRENLEEALQRNLRYITESKRKADITRIVESKRRWNLNKFIGRYGYELFKGVKVWLLTPEVVSEVLPLEMGIFDLLIFDEASQMYVEKGIPSIYRAKKVVVAGDHRQLRPSNLGAVRLDADLDDAIPTALEEESLLDLARARYDSILLNFHYRSRYEELIAFSNRAFYGGRLYVSPNVSDPPEPPIQVHRVDGLWEDKSNRAEGVKIVSLLKEFFDTREDGETVGVITFNASQRDLINDMVDEECARDPVFGAAVAGEMGRTEGGEDVGLFIKNIESVQGDERDVIMFSIGYAKNSEGKLMQRFGWLNNRGGENRLNVAITRAKRKVVIVTSFDPGDLQTEDARNDGPRILKKYLLYADAVSRGDRGRAESILRSFDAGHEDGTGSDPDTTADFICRKLSERGYDVVRDVGIGGYRIDMAVRKGGRYVLGVECDSSLYPLPASTRERDYHRLKYLESRGWRIHRVWTPQVWKNPDKEIDRIAEAVEKGRHGFP